MRKFAANVFHFGRYEGHRYLAAFESSKIRTAEFYAPGKDAEANAECLRDRLARVIGGIELDDAYTVVNQHSRKRVLERWRCEPVRGE